MNVWETDDGKSQKWKLLSVPLCEVVAVDVMERGVDNARSGNFV